MPQHLVDNLVDALRMLVPGRYRSRVYDRNYALAAEAHAKRPASREEQAWAASQVRAMHGTGKTRVLDVGCNTGEPLREIARLVGTNMELHGVDVNLDAIAIARETPGATYWHVPTLPCPGGGLLEGLAGRDDAHFDGYFDHVLLHHAIAHIYCPKAMLRGIARAMKPGGTLTVITSNSRYKVRRILANLKSDYPVDTTVLRHYSSESLFSLLQSVGLNHLSTTFHGPNPSLGDSRPETKLRLWTLAQKAPALVRVEVARPHSPIQARPRTAVAQVARAGFVPGEA